MIPGNPSSNWPLTVAGPYLDSASVDSGIIALPFGTVVACSKTFDRGIDPDRAQIAFCDLQFLLLGAPTIAILQMIFNWQMLYQNDDGTTAWSSGLISKVWQENINAAHGAPQLAKYDLELANLGDHLQGWRMRVSGNDPGTPNMRCIVSNVRIVTGIGTIGDLSV